MEPTRTAPLDAARRWVRKNARVLAVVISAAALMAMAALVCRPRPTFPRLHGDTNGTGYQSTERVMRDLLWFVLPAEEELRKADEEGREVSRERLVAAGLMEGESDAVAGGESLWRAIRVRVVRVWEQHGNIFGVEGQGERFAQSVERTMSEYAPHMRPSEAMKGAAWGFKLQLENALGDER